LAVQEKDLNERNLKFEKSLDMIRQSNEEKKKSWMEKTANEKAKFEADEKIYNAKREELERKTKDISEQLAKSKLVYDEIEAKNKGLEEEKQYYLKKKKALDSEKEYLESRVLEIEEMKKEVQKLSTENTVPDWKKDFEEKKKLLTDPSKAKKKKRGNSATLHPQQIAEKLLREAVLAIKEENFSRFEHVFEQKSEIDFLDFLFEGNSMLHYCVTFNQPKMALLLLGNGALFVPNAKKITPVDQVKAAFEKNADAYKEMLDLFLEWV